MYGILTLEVKIEFNISMNLFCFFSVEKRLKGIWPSKYDKFLSLPIEDSVTKTHWSDISHLATDSVRCQACGICPWRGFIKHGGHINPSSGCTHTYRDVMLIAWLCHYLSDETKERKMLLIWYFRDVDCKFPHPPQYWNLLVPRESLNWIMNNGVFKINGYFVVKF